MKDHGHLERLYLLILLGLVLLSVLGVLAAVYWAETWAGKLGVSFGVGGAVYVAFMGATYWLAASASGPTEPPQEKP